jgi:hypothetical protein
MLPCLIEQIKSITDKLQLKISTTRRNAVIGRR